MEEYDKGINRSTPPRGIQTLSACYMVVAAEIMQYATHMKLVFCSCPAAHPQSAAGLLKDVDGLQIAAPVQALDRVHGQFRKMVLVVRQDLAAQRGSRDVQQVLSQPHSASCSDTGVLKRRRLVVSM